MVQERGVVGVHLPGLHRQHVLRLRALRRAVPAHEDDVRQVAVQLRQVLRAQKKTSQVSAAKKGE